MKYSSLRLQESEVFATLHIMMESKKSRQFSGEEQPWNYQQSQIQIPPDFQKTYISLSLARLCIHLEAEENRSNGETVKETSVSFILPAPG